MAALAEGMDGTAASYVHFRRSWLADRTGDYARAEAEAQAAIVTAGDDLAARSDGLVNLGNALLSLERWAEARAQFEQARELREGLGDRRGAAIAMLGAANAAEELQDFGAAEADYLEALTTFRQLDDISFQAKTTTNLAVLMAMQDRLDAAVPHFDGALHLYRAAGDRVGERKALHNLGLVAAERGDMAIAEARYQDAIRICRDIHDDSGEREALRDLANLYLDSDRSTDLAVVRARLQELESSVIRSP
jgi:tetratricopeptide (TPR) repeat protein